MTEVTTAEEQGLLSRALAAVGLQRIEASVTEQSGEQSGEQTGGSLVPANTTWSQILDYASGSGEFWPFDFYRARLPISRNVAVSYATLNRCVTLIAGSVAQLVTGGNLRVVDSEGRSRNTRRARRVIDLLSTSPDGGVTPAHSFVEDAVADYCLDGNALILPSISGDGMLNRLQRMSPWEAELTYAQQGEGVYRLTPVDGPVVSQYAAARDVIHVRWPRLLRYNAQNRAGRDGFALGPVIALRPALEIGLQGDRYIREWFLRGSRSKIHVDFPTSVGAKPLVRQQRLELAQWVRKYSKSSSPLVTFGGKSSKLEDTPQDEAAKELREFQVHEVAKVFGVPAPLLGVDIVKWGTGIEQLAKLFYRFGLRQHLERFLSPFQIRLLRPGDRFYVDTTDLLRGDADAIQKMIMALQGDAQRPPIATRDELRHIAGLRIDPEGEFVAPAGGVETTEQAGVLAQQEKRNLIECRCKLCQRVIAELKPGSFVRTRCKKCGTWSVFDLT